MLIHSNPLILQSDPIQQLNSTQVAPSQLFKEGADDEVRCDLSGETDWKLEISQFHKFK